MHATCIVETLTWLETTSFYLKSNFMQLWSHVVTSCVMKICDVYRLQHKSVIFQEKIVSYFGPPMLSKAYIPQTPTNVLLNTFISNYFVCILCWSLRDSYPFRRKYQAILIVWLYIQEQFNILTEVDNSLFLIPPSMSCKDN